MPPRQYHKVGGYTVVPRRRRMPRARSASGGTSPAIARHGTRRSASRAEEDAPPVAVDLYERARAQARQPPGVPPAGEDVGSGAMVEQPGEGACRQGVG